MLSPVAVGVFEGTWREAKLLVQLSSKRDEKKKASNEFNDTVKHLIRHGRVHLVTRRTQTTAFGKLFSSFDVRLSTHTANLFWLKDILSVLATVYFLLIIEEEHYA